VLTFYLKGLTNPSPEADTTTQTQPSIIGDGNFLYFFTWFDICQELDTIGLVLKQVFVIQQMSMRT
jgi:hypothetical protein